MGRNIFNRDNLKCTREIWSLSSVLARTAKYHPEGILYIAKGHHL